MRVTRKPGVVWGGVLPTGGVANEPRAKKSLLFPRLYPFRVEPEGLSLVMAGLGNPPPPLRGRPKCPFREKYVC